MENFKNMYRNWQKMSIKILSKFKEKTTIKRIKLIKREKTVLNLSLLI